MIQEGNVCIFDETQNCTDVAWSAGEDNPMCIPRSCEMYQFAADGTDLEPLGLCLKDVALIPGESCTTGCHNGIENPHPWFGGPELTCTGCHAGNKDATTRETAHVPIPAVWQAGSPQWGRPNLRYYWNYNTLYGVENFEGGLEWLRFRNPSDLRVADQSCGKLSGCHQDRVENVRRSVMATEVGLVGVSQARDGIRQAIPNDGNAIYKYDTTTGMTLGWNSLEAVRYNGDYVGSVRQITRFATTDRLQNGAYNQIDILKESYDKQCGNCHLGSAGDNNRYADFRSSGCASCHMPYALDGRSRSLDQMIKKDEPTYPAAYAQIANFDDDDLVNANGAWLGPERSHPLRHQLTRQMASQRCGSCHIGSNRTFLQYTGQQIDPNRVYQTALDNNNLNANQVLFTSLIDNNANAFALYQGLAQNQIVAFLDLNQDGIDDIPADIHYSGGLECMDCHTTGEMHNELKFVKVAKVTDWANSAQVDDMSGALWSHMDQATEVECVHCHGNLEYRARGYAADNRNPVKNLITCPEPGEVIEGYETPAICSTLGAGRFTQSKFTGRYHYTPQTLDTVLDTPAGGGAVRPNGGPLYSRNASVFHGRYQANNDLTDGIGPCFQGNINNCYQDQGNAQGQITENFSHLGDRAEHAADQGAAGLECYACHSTWVNACFGCHLKLVDNDGNGLRRQYAPSTGELTLGQIFEADFTAIAALDMQYGINSEGKIAQFLPETKQHVALVDQNQQNYFGDIFPLLNDANINYNVYRNRDGYGLRQYNTEPVGLPANSDGPTVDQLASMDLNAGQGHNQMMPKSVQRSSPLMDCTNCHLDVNAANLDNILARWMAKADGFANVSDYLTVVQDNNGIQRNNSQQFWGQDVAIAALGYRFDAATDPNGYTVDQQSDYCAYYDINNEGLAPDGFSFCYNNHVMRQGFGDRYRNGLIKYTRGYPTFLNTVAGPLTQGLMNKMFNLVKVQNEGVLPDQGR